MQAVLWSCLKALSVPEDKVYILANHLDEQVATMHLPVLGAMLAHEHQIVFVVKLEGLLRPRERGLPQTQAACTGVKVEGPFKIGHYRFRTSRHWPSFPLDVVFLH